MTGPEPEAALVERAHAKINLYLHVVGRRPDGYHLLDSLAVFAGAHDVVRAAPDAAIGLAIEGRFGAGLAGEDMSGNLVVRAAEALRRVAGVERGAALSLDKRLPVASGIGGGSADAAAALRLLCRLWGGDDPQALARLSNGLALSLGADVPVCVTQRAARMGGVGERLVPAPALPACGLVLVNCGVAVSTPAVFRTRDAGFRPEATLPAAWLDARSMAADLSALHNDLQPPAIALCPEIAVVLAAIGRTDGCLLARMSGSGATCFGLFPDEAMAATAAAALERPGWWVWGGGLLPADGAS